MLKKTVFTGSLLLVLGLTSVGAVHAHQDHPQENVQIIHAFDPVIIRVEGYGTSGQTDVQTNAQQRRLLAMRASKVDAYRALAERVYGTRIQGHTSVQNLAARDDSIRAFVDSVVLGAKVISTSHQSDGIFKTQLELVLGPHMQHCMTNNRARAIDPACAQATVHGEHPSQRLPAPQPRVDYYPNQHYYPHDHHASPHSYSRPVQHKSRYHLY